MKHFSQAKADSVGLGANAEVKTAGAKTERSIDDTIDRIGLGPFQWKLLAICGMTWAADAMEVLLMSFALPGVRAEFGIDVPSSVSLITATFLGMFVGAPFWGYLSDRIGRRRVFLTTVTLGVIFGLSGAFAPSVALLLLARFMTGFAIGGTLPVDYAMMAEFVPTEWRGKFLVYLESFWALGTLMVAGLAWGTSAMFPPEMSWRWMLGLAALPGLVGLIARFGIPDSPRHLLLRGKTAQAHAAVATVARSNGQIGALSGIKLLAPTNAGKVTVSDLFGAHLRKRTLLMAVAWFGLSLGYYGIFNWLPRYLQAGGMELTQVYQNTVILALAQIPGYILAAYLVDKIGRRPTLAGFLALSAVGAYLFLTADGATSVLLTSCLLSFALLGAWGSIYAYTMEVFPTALRSTSMGMMSATARGAGLIAPSIGALLITGNLGWALTVFSAALAIAALAAWSIGIETRSAQLEDVDAEAIGQVPARTLEHV